MFIRDGLGFVFADVNDVFHLLGKRQPPLFQTVGILKDQSRIITIFSVSKVPEAA